MVVGEAASAEVEMLRLLAADYSNQEVADALYLSVRTVESTIRVRPFGDGSPDAGITVVLLIK